MQNVKKRAEPHTLLLGLHHEGVQLGAVVEVLRPRHPPREGHLRAPPGRRLGCWSEDRRHPVDGQYCIRADSLEQKNTQPTFAPPTPSLAITKLIPNQITRPPILLISCNDQTQFPPNPTQPVFLVNWLANFTCLHVDVRKSLESFGTEMIELHNATLEIAGRIRWE